MGNRGAFAKAFSEHRKNGGTLTRKEFGEEFKKKNKKQNVSEENKV